MAINIFCPGCKGSFAEVLGEKKWVCPKCGAEYGRHDRQYRVTVSYKGKRRSEVVPNLTIAREKESTLHSDLMRDRMEIYDEHKIPTLADVWKDYLPWAQKNKKSWRDDRYRYEKHIKPGLGPKRLDQITAFQIETLKSRLKNETNAHGRPYAAATVKQVLVLIRRLFNVARKWGRYNGESPTAKVRMPAVDNLVTEFLTQDELNRLHKTLAGWPNKETGDFILFALNTGFRRGELFGLEWRDIDFTRELVTLRSPKGGRSVSLPVNEVAVEILKRRSKRPRSEIYVFPGKKGNRRTDFKGPWHRVRAAAGLPEGFRFHGLRHAFASALVSSGEDLYVVQRLLTHKDPKLTQRYAHLSPSALRNAARRSGELLQAKKEVKTDEQAQAE